MLQDLPQEIDPLRFARAEKQLIGQFEIKAMERLHALLFEDSGKVEFELSFGRDDQNGFYFIAGHVIADLHIICQRCLNGLEFHIDNPVKLGIVHNKSEADLLPPDYEPFLLVENTVQLVDLIEDELLLAMPISALHDKDKCSVTLQQSGDEKPNPFAKLVNLKSNIQN